MAEVKIFWTVTALKQRTQIFTYWNERNGNFLYSRKLKGLITERLQLLKKHPKLGKDTNFESTRILIIGHYTVLHTKFFYLKLLSPGFGITAEIQYNS